MFSENLYIFCMPIFEEEEEKKKACLSLFLFSLPSIPIALHHPSHSIKCNASEINKAVSLFSVTATLRARDQKDAST